MRRLGRNGCSWPKKALRKTSKRKSAKRRQNNGNLLLSRQSGEEEIFLALFRFRLFAAAERKHSQQTEPEDGERCGFRHTDPAEKAVTFIVNARCKIQRVERPSIAAVSEAQSPQTVY